MNAVNLTGRLATDPVLAYTPSGLAVAEFRIAVRDPFTKNAEGRPGSDFFDAKAWRERGEYCVNYLSKGAVVSLRGRLKCEDWENREGQKRRNYYVLVEEIESYAKPGSPAGADHEPAKGELTTVGAEDYHDPFADP